MVEAIGHSRHIGVLGGFHFCIQSDWRPKYSRYLRTEGRASAGFVQIAQFQHIGGAGYICRTNIAQKFSSKLLTTRGLKGGWTTVQQYMHRGGYVNGYVYPLIQIEHLPDPIFGKSQEGGKRSSLNQLRRALRTEARMYLLKFGIENNRGEM